MIHKTPCPNPSCATGMVSDQEKEQGHKECGDCRVKEKLETEKKAQATAINKHMRRAL